MFILISGAFEARSSLLQALTFDYAAKEFAKKKLALGVDENCEHLGLFRPRENTPI